MSAEQRRLFEETLAEDEAALQALLEQAKGTPPEDNAASSKRKPRRQPRPNHLRRVQHNYEPEDTACPSPGCGKPMVRVGEDISEKLDIVPAEFFVHRHVYGKWACRCCQRLVQEAVEPQLIDGGMPAAGLVAHTLIRRFVDHLPYYRQEAINARSGVHTPRSTLAAWSGRGGAALEPLYDAHKRFVPRQMAKKLQSMDDLFKGRHFEREIIVLCVRWYLRFKLSLRDLVEMMAERA